MEYRKIRWDLGFMAFYRTGQGISTNKDWYKNIKIVNFKFKMGKSEEKTVFNGGRGLRQARHSLEGAYAL